MKKLFFLSALIAGSLSIQTASAQFGLHVNINLGPRPVYEQAPPPMPVADDDYYYLPDAEAYYSVPEQVYYYQDNGRWISSPRLAGRYRDYDYNRMRHYAINESRPYLRNDYYRARFSNPQFAGRNNGNVRNENYGRSFDNRGDNRGRGGNINRRDQDQHFANNNSRGGRDDHRDNGNHNGWNRN